MINVKLELGLCINISHYYQNKAVEAQCEIIAEGITTTILKNIDLLSNVLSKNSKKGYHRLHQKLKSCVVLFE